MKRFLTLIILNSLPLLSLGAYEVYGTNIYPGAVNHQNSSYSYGMFSLNTMESTFREITVTRTLASNNSRTTYHYEYGSDGRLVLYSDSSGTYEYTYRDGNLATVKFNGKDIYFPSPYFISIRKGGDELIINRETDDKGELKAMVLDDENGTKFFFEGGRIASEESIGTNDNRFSASYEYDEKGRIKRFRKETREGRGESQKRTEYVFFYKDGTIADYFQQKTGLNREFARTHYIFDSIADDSGRVVKIFAQDDEGNIVATADFQYSGAGSYTLNVSDDRNRLMEEIIVESK